MARISLEHIQKKPKGKTDTSVLLRQSVRMGKKVVICMKQPRSAEQTRKADRGKVFAKWPVVLDRLRSIRVIGLWRKETFLEYKVIRPTSQQQPILDLAGVCLPPLRTRFART